MVLGDDGSHRTTERINWNNLQRDRLAIRLSDDPHRQNDPMALDEPPPTTNTFIFNPHCCLKGGVYSCHAWPSWYGHRQAHPYNAVTEHVGLLPIRQASLSATGRGVTFASFVLSRSEQLGRVTATFPDCLKRCHAFWFTI